MPRTGTTRKLRRAEIAERIGKGEKSAASSRAPALLELVQKFAPGRVITPETTLEELGISSLDRVELMMELEEKLDISIDESAFASVSKVADLANRLGAGGANALSPIQPQLAGTLGSPPLARVDSASAHTILCPYPGIGTRASERSPRSGDFCGQSSELSGCPWSSSRAFRRAGAIALLQ